MVEETNGEVISVIDSMIANHDPNLACNHCKRTWTRIKESIPFLISVPNSHDIVRDMEGNLVCRPCKFTMDNLYSSPKFRFYSSIMRMWLIEEIERLEIRPNVFIALGGASTFSQELLISLRNFGYYLEYGSIVMHKVLEGKEGRMTGVRLSETRHIPGLKLEDLNVVVVEDFIDTGTQAGMAVAKMRSLGSKVLGVLSFANSFGKYWPYGTLLNLTFANLNSRKYEAGYCPECYGKLSMAR